MKKLAWTLVIIGALNWGLVGLGMLLGNGASWNLVEWIFGMGTLAGIVYLLVGISAITSITGCRGCKNGHCDVHGKRGGQM